MHRPARLREINSLEMPSVIELAEHAGVSVEALLRGLAAEPVSETEAREIADAIGELGRPSQGVVESLNILTAARVPLEEPEEEEEPPDDDLAGGAADFVAAVRRSLLEALAETPIRLERDPIEADAPEAPRHLGYMGGIVDDLVRSLDALGRDIPDDQQERLGEARFLLGVLVTTWGSVERRLQLVERRLDRQARERDADARA